MKILGKSKWQRVVEVFMKIPVMFKVKHIRTEHFLPKFLEGAGGVGSKSGCVVTVGPVHAEPVFGGTRGRAMSEDCGEYKLI